MVLVDRRYKENDRTSSSSIVHPVAHTYIHSYKGNDSGNIERIVEKPPSVDANIWKYEHVRQFVLELNLLATSLKDLCTKESCPTMKGNA